MVSPYTLGDMGMSAMSSPTFPVQSKFGQTCTQMAPVFSFHNNSSQGAGHMRRSLLSAWDDMIMAAVASDTLLLCVYTAAAVPPVTISFVGRHYLYLSIIIIYFLLCYHYYYY
jgi:hypothetical protein